MVKNYFKIAFRNLWKHRVFSLINIMGLTIGMAAATLIFLWVRSELTFDRFYPKADQLFKVYNKDTFNGEVVLWDKTPNPLGPALKKDYPEVIEMSRFARHTFLFSINNEDINIDGAFADSSFFALFDLSFVYGNQQEALHNNNGIVITESLASRLFGSQDAIGQTVRIDRKDNFMVTGVIDDLPDNSHFRGVEYFLPWHYMETSHLSVPKEFWTHTPSTTFVLLRKDAGINAVNNKIKHITRAYASQKGLINREIFLHPAKKWHLYTQPENGELIGGKRVQLVRLFTGIGFFILLIACINFTNLSTAASEKRAKEVGIRKAIGGRRGMLISQFLGESVLIAFMAGVLALLLVWVSLPAFNTLIQKSLFLDLSSPWFWLCGIGFALITGILAGSYPAFFLSAFRPVSTLKGQVSVSRSGIAPRKILVISQFVFSTLLIMCTLVIKDQIEYAQARDNGYDKNNLISVELSGDLRKNYHLVKQRLLDNGAAIAVTKSLGRITRQDIGYFGYSWPGSTEADSEIPFIGLSTDADFQSAMGVEIVKGRDIDSYTYTTDSTAILLNETAVKTMRLKDPIGTVVKQGEQSWRVVGVIKDFILNSPYEPIRPLIVMGPSSWFNFMYIKLNPGNTTAKNLKLTGQIFDEYNPGYPFEYQFTDELYAGNFEDEQRTASLAALFSGLAIFISCLGLFGLTTYTAERRGKEISIRKVMGATEGGIVRLLSKDFVKLAAIAFVIASPVAYYMMSSWLEGFSYRVSIAWHVFAVSGSLVILITILTVSFQAVSAALANPVKSLRSE